MSDQRFSDRLKRIEARNAGGFHAELLAGVGEVAEAKKTATSHDPDRPKASLILAMLGAAVGFFAFQTMRDTLGIEALTTLQPGALLAIGRSDPLIGASFGVLGLCGLMALFSLLRGRKAFRMMSFSWAAVGAVVSSAFVLG